MVTILLAVLLCACSVIAYGAVQPKASTVTFDRDWASVAIGSTVQLNASSSTSVTWKSSDTSLATVDQNGKVTGLKKGMVTITATSNGKTDTCQVSVGMTQGIDVSSWNQTVDWAKVKKKGVDFAIIRVGYGWENYPNQIDKQFVNNVKGAVQNGIDFGLYFYSYATNVDEAKMEADYLFRLLEDYAPGYVSSMTLPIVYDVEEPCMQNLDKATLSAVVKTFCTEVQKAGYDAMVYSGKYIFPKMDIESLREMGVTFWLAQYPKEPDFTAMPDMGSSAAQPAIWQYASDGSVDGANVPTSGCVDVNVRYWVPEVESVSVTSSGGVKVSWSALPGAKSYTLYRRDNSTNKETVVKSGLTGTSYTDSSCPEGKDVYYYLTASTSKGTVSGAYTGKQAYVLPTPELTSVKSTSSGITVNWKAVSNAQGYRIYRKNEKGNWVGLENVSSSQTTYTDTTADPDQSYTYTVRAYRYGGVLGGGVQYYSGYETQGITSLICPDFTLTNSASGISISWDQVSGAQNYRIYRRNSATDGWTQLAEITGTSYSDTTAEAGVTYYYTVRAFDGSTYGNYIPDETILRLTVPEFTITNDTNGVTIDWEKVAGAQTYRVYRRTSATGSWTQLTEVSDLSYTDETAKSGTTYYYTVRAFAGSDSSRYISDSTICFLENPQVETSCVKGVVTVSWEKINGASGYRVYRRESESDDWDQIATTSTPSYTDKNAKEGQTYYYTARAYHGDDLSTYELFPDITVLACPEFTMTNRTNGVTIDWEKVAGAQTYRVYRRTSATGSWTQLTEVSGLSYTDQTAKSGTTYYYTVRAYAGSNSSRYISTRTTIFLENPQVETSCVKSVVTVSWEKITGASGYRVYRRESESDGWTQIATTSTPSYTDKNAEEGQTYYYTARAYHGSVLSTYELFPGITVLVCPEFTMTNSTNGVTIEWEEVAGAQTYRVYRRTSATGSWTQLTEVSGLSYTDQTAKSGTTYYYTVRAYAGSNSSRYISTCTTIFLENPQVETSCVKGVVTVSWEKITGASGYRVYRRESESDGWTQIATTSTPSYTDKSAKEGQTYYYTARAYHGSVLSTYELFPGITVLACPEFTMTNGTNGVTVAWEKVTGAQTYRVYRRTSATGSWTQLTEVSGLSYTDKTAKSGTTYYYTVRAYAGSNSSRYYADRTILCR